MRKAFEESESAEKALAMLSIDFRTERAARTASLQDLIPLMPSNTALVAYARYEDTGEQLARALGGNTRLNDSRNSAAQSTPSYIAFVLAPGDSTPVAVRLGTAAEIEGLVHEWSQSARMALDRHGHDREGSESSYRQTGRHLRQAIWDPLAKDLGKAERVFVVPDGSLHLLNIAALPADREKYLLETGPEIHYLSAERDLLKPLKQSRYGSGLLALGGADYESTEVFADLRGNESTSAPSSEYQNASLSLVPGDPTDRGRCGAMRGAKFRRLRSAEREAVEVVDLWNRARAEGPSTTTRTAGVARLLSGSDASEKRFKAMAPGRKILHIATHGFFFGDQCPAASLSSRGVILMGPAEESQPLPLVGDNPLLFSGFALAGANLRDFAGEDDEDGILTSQEISAMDLGGLDLAVLAGCDTGAGKIEDGEGVLGLRRAFKTAGAATVLMSLWSIKDSVARNWMVRFYEKRLIEKQEISGAVRSASLEVLIERRAEGESTHPYYWGGWIASGDWQ
jgi:CHAT domain-containing protein